ncbi:MAG TPA: hypothetical protein VMW63_00770 [Methanoregulaceae archaeon]|nr:hypothetical protein [Methanoregulaceae archaeon]
MRERLVKKRKYDCQPTHQRRCILKDIGYTLISITVPAAVAALIRDEIKDAAYGAEDGVSLTGAIPGAGERAFEVAKLARYV